MPLFQTAQGANRNRLPSLCYACMANSSLEQRFTTSATFNRDPVTCRYAKILPTKPGARKRTVLNPHWILARVNVCQSSSALGSFVRGHVACPKSIDASVSSASFILLYSFSYFFHTGRASRTFMPKHRDSLRAIGRHSQESQQQSNLKTTATNNASKMTELGFFAVFAIASFRALRAASCY
jgi:hypothetical protein